MQTDRVEMIFDTNKKIYQRHWGNWFCWQVERCIVLQREIVWLQEREMETFHVDAKIKSNVTRIPNFTFSTKTTELDDSFYPPQVHITFENKCFNAREILN